MTRVILDDNVPTSRKKTPPFFGEGMKKGRIIFVIDVSGSMSLQASSERVKLKVVKEELMNAIKAMNKRYEFNIIFYSTGMAKWRPNLQEATEENKKAAIEFIKSRPPAGMTNIHGALRLAMEDAEVKLIILLTGGQPTVDRQREGFGRCAQAEQIPSYSDKHNRLERGGCGPQTSCGGSPSRTKAPPR